jgi:phenol 2-monooxygenase
MQFHLNGYRPGDPAVSTAARERPPIGELPAEVDVLIVGAGPTGLTLAAQLAAFPQIRTAIVEQKSGPLEVGQADGIAVRTVEMFEAFGFAERALKEAYWVNETAFWKPDPVRRDHIARSGRVQDVEDGLSEFPHLILNQARVHDFYLDVMRTAAAPLAPTYACRVLDVVRDAAPDGPVAVSLQRQDGDHLSRVETVRARYVVGCDGARSEVRKALGLSLDGDSANQAWGVMDVLVVTDFPDIRLKAVIHSAQAGNVLIIPREGGYLVRLYIELDELAPGERVAARNITPERLIDQARRVLHPYALEVKEVAWWSVYEIGQRLTDRFDDADDALGRPPRVFIAGDACHTHSPKAGQGMNVSMADAFNLGWKLAAVLCGQSDPRLLATYSAERRGVAQALIDFDREFAAMFSARPKDPENPQSQGVDPAEFQRFFVRQGRFTAGTAVHYGPSCIVAAEPRQHHAKGFQVGMRFHSAPVIRLADAKPMQLGHALKADGRWRLIAFADAEPTAPNSRLGTLCERLGPLLDRITPPGLDPDAVVDLRAVLQQTHRDVAHAALPPRLRPRKGRHGLIDYEKIFCADTVADIFELREVDRAGCLVVVRPDQFIAQVLPLDAHQILAEFLTGIFLDLSR